MEPTISDRRFGIVKRDGGEVACAGGFELIGRVAAKAEQVEGGGAVQKAGIHVRQAEMAGEGLGDRSLAAGGGPVDGNDDGALVGVVLAHRPGALTGPDAYGKAPADCRRPRRRGD